MTLYYWENTFDKTRGLDVARCIQEKIKVDQPAVVLLSSIIERMGSDAIQGRISKPVHYKSLYNTIHKLTVLQK